VTAVALLPLANSNLDPRVRVAAVIATAFMVGVVLELVRRRRLVERYALVWMIVSVLLLVLAIWTDLLRVAADALHIAVPANFLFLAAIGVAYLLLLHFSVITSRLSEETKVLAQEVARLDVELRTARNGTGTDGDGAQAREPSTATTADQ
jgi:hypothetical protein